MLSRDTIITAFTQLSDELGRRGIMGELNIVGGTAMLLAFNARTSTKDVDAIFEPSADVRKAAAVVANALELPADWLNDSVKGFLSPTGDFTPPPIHQPPKPPRSSPDTRIHARHEGPRRTRRSRK